MKTHTETVHSGTDWSLLVTIAFAERSQNVGYCIYVCSRLVYCSFLQLLGRLHFFRERIHLAGVSLSKSRHSHIVVWIYLAFSRLTETIVTYHRFVIAIYQVRISSEAPAVIIRFSVAIHQFLRGKVKNYPHFCFPIYLHKSRG
jgi:hypothetical protein